MIIHNYLDYVLVGHMWEYLYNKYYIRTKKQTKYLHMVRLTTVALRYCYNCSKLLLYKKKTIYIKHWESSIRTNYETAEIK